MTEIEQRAVDCIISDRKAFVTIKAGHSIAIRDKVVVRGCMELYNSRTPIEPSYTSVLVTPEMFRLVCLHNQFRVDAAVGRIMSTQGDEKKEANEQAPADYYHVDLKLCCLECGQEFQWQGLPHGYSPYQPTVSIDGKTMMVPAMPVGKSVPLGMIGYRVSIQNFESSEKDPIKQ